MRLNLICLLAGLWLSLCSEVLSAQNTPTNEQVFRFDAFMGFVKKNHPRVKRAQIRLSEAEAALLQARGGFDPKVAVDFDKKEFKNTTYYSVLNSTFKVPTWYGVELKAGFEQTDGYYLSPENTTPIQGLAAVGATVSLAQNLWINPRMADLRKAKAGLTLGRAQQQLDALQVLFEAALAYHNWVRTHAELTLYQNYVSQAQNRLQGIQGLIRLGDKPAIDSVEAGILYKNRQISLIEAQIKHNKARLELSNFLWLDNNIPLELQPDQIPDPELEAHVGESLPLQEVLLPNWGVNSHPKLVSMEQKINQLNIDRQLKINQLLPRIDVGYAYLTTPEGWNKTPWTDYKLSLNVAFPLLLRKERGSVKLARLKLTDAQLDLGWEKIQLENKAKALRQEYNNLGQQLRLYRELVDASETLLRSEQRLFEAGESSLFLLNTRENNLITARLNLQATQFRYWSVYTELYRTQGVTGL